MEVISHGEVLTRTRTDPDGQFRLSIEPGVFVIRATADGGPSTTTRTITVTSDSPGTLALTLPTGIRHPHVPE